MPAAPQATKADSRGDISAKVTPEPDLRALIYDTAHENSKPFKQLAADINLHDKQLYRAVSLHEPSPFHVEWLVPLMRAARDFSALRWMARACGFLLVECPPVETPADVMQSVGCIARETGDVLRTLGEVLADGHVCARDAQQARRELAELLEHAHALDQALARIEAR